MATHGIFDVFPSLRFEIVVANPSRYSVTLEKQQRSAAISETPPQKFPYDFNEAFPYASVPQYRYTLNAMHYKPKTDRLKKICNPGNMQDSNENPFTY